VVLLAADLPFVDGATVTALLAELRAPFARSGPDDAKCARNSTHSWDGAVLVDDAGRDQYLCAAWRVAALRDADLSVDRLGLLVAQLDYARLSLPVVPGRPPPWTDCDTPDQLGAARAQT
jgi:molybdenum cofactor guanylyltransferase